MPTPWRANVTGPVSAAAGIATLLQVRDTDALDKANRAAAALRDGMNQAIRRRGLGWSAYGLFSDFHLYCAPSTPEDIYAGQIPWQQLKGGISTELAHKIRAGLLFHGVDITGWPGGLVSAAHTDEDIRITVDAFDATLGMLAEEGDL